jgi:hypothetical protein
LEESLGWFGEDTFLKFLHVLNPAWITQGVYKILTAKKTANLFGQVRVNDFKELLQPVNIIRAVSYFGTEISDDKFKDKADMQQKFSPILV